MATNRSRVEGGDSRQLREEASSRATSTPCRRPIPTFWNGSRPRGEDLLRPGPNSANSYRSPLGVSGSSRRFTEEGKAPSSVKISPPAEGHTESRWPCAGWRVRSTALLSRCYRRLQRGQRLREAERGNGGGSGTPVTASPGFRMKGTAEKRSGAPWRERTTRYPAMTAARDRWKGEAACSTPSTIPTLIVGAIIGVVTVIMWGRWQNRRGGDR